ncbi:Putative spliceosomal protein fbp21 [Gryllus bimaculatus]|nr:Putative spliceosomal protein fbp21 [Gryllus bimaculatus]
MADYWKSNAKKYCDFCKCWIADNKPSVDFHEKGKRHKENVALKLKNISRQSAKDHKEKKKLDEDFKKMEKAALEAYMKDVERNADYTSQLLNQQLEANKSKETCPPSVNDEKTERKGKKVNESKEDTEQKSDTKILKTWHEAVSDEGYTYYWNTTTGESVWEPPEEGFTSLDEQKKLEKEEIQKEAKKKIEEARQKEEQEKMKAEEYRAFIEREKMKKRAKVEEKIETKSSIVMGPAPRGNPYGSWTTIKRRDCKSWEAG